MKTLEMLQSFVRAGVCSNDLGYLTKWLMADYQNISLVDYIAEINSYLKDGFFDTPNRIKKVVDYYQKYIDGQLNSLESQSYEG